MVRVRVRLRLRVRVREVAQNLYSGFLVEGMGGRIDFLGRQFCSILTVPVISSESIDALRA